MTSGLGGRNIATKEECEEGTKAIGWPSMSANLKTEARIEHPPGCFLYDDQLQFNSDFSSETECAYIHSSSNLHLPFF